MNSTINNGETNTGNSDDRSTSNVRRPEIIDLDQEPDHLCIDLTDDVDIEQEIVDLTSPENNNNNNAPVMIGNGLASPVLRGNSRISLDDSDEELPPTDFNTPARKPNSSLDTDYTPGRAVSCPVCLDNYRQIRGLNKTLTSTVCGHVFCNECITGAIQAQGRCPTCRKKLSKKQIHPLFL